VRHGWLNGGPASWLGACTVLLAAACAGRAGDEADAKKAELRALIEQQGKEIEELQQMLSARTALQEKEGAPPGDEQPPKGPGGPRPGAGPGGAAGAGGEAGAGGTTEFRLDDASVRKIIAAFLKDNPGAGMPPSVQTGAFAGQGFVIRSGPNPSYVKWDDDCKIPFELRVRARIQLAYYGYKVTDTTNHMTGLPATANANAVRLADFSQLEAKRVQLFFEGTLFDPDLRYHIRLHGDTRGLPGLQNNKVVQTTPPGGFNPAGTAISPLGGGVTLDHAVRLFECWLAYDFHGCCSQKGCGPDCPDDHPRYAPTYTLTAGKIKPFFGLEEYLGNQNEQFVEFNMADLFFDADGDNRLMAAGTMVKAAEDRFFMQAIVTNGSDNLFANSQLDQYPGFITGFWYDLGGRWNYERKAWDLFGDCISDIDYSCCPVVRLGGCANVVPMGRRSLYGDAEQSRFFTMQGGPGGTRLINVLNGDLASPNGAHAVDMFDAYSANVFVAGKYHGFSVLNEWWVRDLNNFRTTPNGRGDIIYTSGFGNALFPANRGLVDYGTNLQGGYFIIPKKLELAVRWSWIRGQSGDINGDDKFTTINVKGTRMIPGVTGPVRVVDGAFRNFHEANEYTVGVNYFFKRHLWKWQTDFSIYDGGNPAGEGSSIAGFIPGSDGYMLRTQIQLFF
jgi:hypothetical protein